MNDDELVGEIGDELATAFNKQAAVSNVFCYKAFLSESYFKTNVVACCDLCGNEDRSANVS